MSLLQNDFYNETRHERREMWLSEHGRDGGDVMEDALGEYIMVSHDEEDDWITSELYLPEEFQKYYVPF